MNANNGLFDTLKARGYIYQSTDNATLKNLIDGDKPLTFYLGVDPTASSLHIGHFFALMMFRHLQNAGHKGILVFGGATALVGDPSGKSDMRSMLSAQQVQDNIQQVIKIASKFIQMDGDNPALIVNNADWFKGYEFVSFMRDIGTHFNVNKMLSADAYANRIKQGGLTFLEMGYMLMQSYDFIYLANKFGCRLQIGGSDQWGNIVAGTDLYRKMKYGETKKVGNNIYDNIYGLTCPLLLTKDGQKMGKTVNGALWVDSNKTSPYDFYQYFYNIDDKDTAMLLKLFTQISLQEIEQIINTDIIKAKKLMAYEITKLVHGQSETDKVVDATNSLFGGNIQSQNIPSITLPLTRLRQGINIIDLFVETQLVATKSQCRQLIDGGGLLIDDKKVTDYKMIVSQSSLQDNTTILKKGKKNFLKVIFQ